MKKENFDIESIKKRIDNLIVKRSQIAYLKTNIKLIDNFLAGFNDVEEDRGGFIRGKLYSFSGGAGVGKSTFLLYICKQIVNNNKILYIDTENGLNNNMLINMGLNDFKAENTDEFLNNKNLFILNAYTYSETINIIKDLINIVKIDLIIVDSIKHLLTEETIDSNSENVDSLLLDKRVESYFFPILKNIARKNDIVICFIQQVRIKRKGMFFVVDESGGNAFLHTIDCRYMMKQKDFIKATVLNNENELVEKNIGNIVEIETKKSRFGMNSITLPILYGKGISFVYYYFRLLKNLKYITNIGSMYNIKIDNVIDIKVKGQNQCYNIIKEKFSEIEKFLIDNKLLKIESNKNEDDENF